MSLIWMDGFDAYGTQGQSLSNVMASSLYMRGTVYADNNTRTGRGYAIKFDLGGGNGPSGEIIKAFESKSELVVGFAWKIGNINSLHTICEFSYDNQFGTVRKQFGMWMAADGALSVGWIVGNTRYLLFTSGPNMLFTNVWHFIEVKIRFHDTEGSIQVKIDGQTCISGTGRTKDAAAPALCNVFRAGHYYLEDTTLLDIYLDDLYICDTEGTDFNDFLGDVVIHTVLPSGDGDLNELSQFGGSLAHYTAVDEIPPDNDVSYLYGNEVGKQELFTVDELPQNVINVLAVSVHARVKKDAAGASALKIACKYDGVTALSSIQPVTTQYVTRAQIFEEAPGGGGWTKEKAEAMQIGFEVA